MVDPVLITLTYPAGNDRTPAEWLEIDRKAWPEFIRRWKSRWDIVPPFLWSLQWTKGQVPHRHLVLPSNEVRTLEFKTWLLRTWASIIGVDYDPTAGHEHLVDIRAKRHVGNLIRYVLRDLGEPFEVVGPQGTAYRRSGTSDDWPQCRIGRLREFIGMDGKIFDWHKYQRAKGRRQYWRRRFIEAEQASLDPSTVEKIRHKYVEILEELERWVEQRPDPDSWKRRGNRYDEYVALIDGEIVWLEDGDQNDSFSPTADSYRRVISQANRAWDRFKESESIADTADIYEAQLRFKTAKFMIASASCRADHLEDPDEQYVCRDLIGVVTSDGCRIAAQLPYLCPGCQRPWGFESPLMSEYCIICDPNRSSDRIGRD